MKDQGASAVSLGKREPDWQFCFHFTRRLLLGTLLFSLVPLLFGLVVSFVLTQLIPSTGLLTLAVCLLNLAIVVGAMTLTVKLMLANGFKGYRIKVERHAADPSPSAD